MKVYSFLQLECKWHMSMVCDHILTSEVHFVLTYITWWTVHIQYDNFVQCDISLYIFTIHYNVIWKSYISFYVICLPSYRPYNLLEKKKTLDLLCMLCNLCFVSVKKVEKWVSWLLVSVEMAPSEIVLEDNSQVWHSKKIWFPGHDNLRSHATPTPTPSTLHSPAPRHHQHTDTSTQAHTQTQPRALAGPFCCGEERCYLTVPSSIPLVIIYSVSQADLN